MNALGKIAVGAVAVVTTATVVILMCGSGEKAEVEALLRQAVKDGAAGDAEKCISYVASDYSYGGQTYADVCALIRRTVGPDRRRSVEVRSLEVGVEGEVATAVLEFGVESEEAVIGRPIPVRLNLHLKKSRDGWKVTGYEVRER
ncbi:MAG: hypothetical protein HYY16_09440 [Planctomycetes bacterium]|nr:hypothetical protein [Planctomycetota bacterium]